MSQADEPTGGEPVLASVGKADRKPKRLRTTYLTAALCAVLLLAAGIGQADTGTYRLRTPAPITTITPAATAQVTLPVWVCEPDGSFCSATTVIGGETVALVRNSDGSIFVTFTDPTQTQCGTFGLDPTGKYFTSRCD